MHAYTLWYTNNPVIEKYTFHYESILREKIQKLNTDGIISSEFLSLPSEFLLIPDISSNFDSFDAKVLPFLWNEWENFKKSWLDWMESTKGKRIPWTQILLTPHDWNPDRYLEAHPDRINSWNTLGFWWKSDSEWFHLFEKSFAILTAISPGFTDELSNMIRKIIPMGISHGTHNSASYSRCIGHIYMSYPSGMEYSELALLEAIIHESNHNKLNLILRCEPLLNNTFHEIYYSPYRPDPRHIHGIYLWLHAMVWVFSIFFEAVERWLLTLDGGWMEKSLAYVMKNALSIRVLERYGQFTKKWEEIFLEMKTIHQETSNRIKYLAIPDEFRHHATERVHEHFKKALHDATFIHY